MILTGEDPSTWKNSSFTAILSVTNSKIVELGSTQFIGHYSLESGGLDHEKF